MSHRRPMAIADRIAAKVSLDVATGCLNWTGALNHNGYGEVSIGGGIHRRAHRLAYEVANGPIPAGLQIDHLCRNRRCCNPDHLEAVTREENIARGNAPHIVNSRKTHCKRGHEFTPENTYLYSHGGRECRACRTPYQTAKLAAVARDLKQAVSGVSRRGGQP